MRKFNLKSVLIDTVLITVGAVLLIGICLGLSAICHTTADAMSSVINTALFGI